MVGYLVDVGIKLLEMDAMRASIGNIGKETARQFALYADVPLFDVSILLARIRRG